jgi:glucose-1-phosphatase
LWAQLGLNQRPPDYESGATNQLSYGPGFCFDNFFVSLQSDCKSNKFYHSAKILYSFFSNRMKINNNITTLIFDFGGVIINLDLAQCIENLKKLGLTDVEQYLSNFGQKEFFLQYEKGEIGTEQFREEIKKMAGIPLKDDDIDAAWCSFLCDIPDTKIEVLTRLKKKYRLLLLSNTNPLHIGISGAGEFARRGKTVYDFFDRCYFSYEMHLAKPDPQIFYALMADANVQPEECLFLDDGQKNIDTASKLGINSYLVKPGEDLSFLLNL